MIRKWGRPHYWRIWVLAFIIERTDTYKLILALQRRGYDVISVTGLRLINPWKDGT